jgi:protoporphyrinogen oxidase
MIVLGGGPAGLAVGYYAGKRGVAFTIFEASDHIGGNCITFSHGDFRFDSGAHRFHDKFPDVTAEMRGLLDGDFQKIDAPSSIFFRDRFIDFPLSPLNLMNKLGLQTFFKAGFQLMAARVSGKDKDKSFENFAVHTYGKSIAEFFLLGYSEKLWGLPSGRLSPQISGSRMKGLDLKVFLKEAFLGSKAKTEHLDGAFYYPSMGIGTISDKLGSFCGEKNIRKSSRITRIMHDRKKIHAVELNGLDVVDTDFVVSTLPLDNFLRMMYPMPGKDILRISRSLRYRSVLLAAFFLDRESVSDSASIYFPDTDIPFTRVHEPKNRSKKMSPPGKTSLIVETPCQIDDAVWKMPDAQLILMVRSKLINAGLMNKKEILGSAVRRMPYAYPVLEIGFEKNIGIISEFLKEFSNLRFSGRNGRFVYGHIHDMMSMGKGIVQEYLASH